MNKESVLENLNTIFIDVLDDEDISLSPATTADDIEDWDSLTHINLIVAIEQEYKMKFALGELEALKNVGDMCDLIIKKTSK